MSVVNVLILLFCICKIEQGLTSHQTHYRSYWGHLLSIFSYQHISICDPLTHLQLAQDSQLSQRDRAAGCVIVFAKSRTLELGDNILRTL